MTSHLGKINLWEIDLMQVSNAQQTNPRESIGHFAHLLGCIPSGECYHGWDLEKTYLKCVC
jgi:hypothetical protein